MTAKKPQAKKPSKKTEKAGGKGKARQVAKPSGRPSDYTEEMATLICARIASGESVRTITRDDNMPAMSTVFVWLAKHDAFAEQYARARETQADAIFEEILDIADDGTNDWMERRDDKGAVASWQVNGEHIQRSKLRVDARKWMAGKLAPKKYGEKAALELTGKDGGVIKTEGATTIDLSGATLDQLQAIAKLRIPATNGG